MQVGDLERILRAHFGDADVRVRDLTGTSDHFEIEVRSERFRDQSLLEQHRMVHEALGERLGAEIHAVKIKTRLP